MFRPWVGENYGADDLPIGSKRLLILGESHHSQEHPVGTLVPDMTVDVVSYYQTGPWVPWMRTLDNAAAAIAGKSKRELGRAGVNAIWDQIAFYNYVPVVAASGSRSRPTGEHFEMGAEPFRQLLVDLSPRAIIVCGYELWARIVPHHAQAYTENPWRPETSFAELGPRKIPALRMVHPSTAFSPARWAPQIADLLAKAEGAPAGAPA